MAYINTYEVTREYAGAEEGGCFFTNRHPVASVRIRGGANSDRARQAFNAYAKAWGMKQEGYYGERMPGYWRSSGQIDYLKCVIESGPAKAWDNYQPYS